MLENSPIGLANYIILTIVPDCVKIGVRHEALLYWNKKILDSKLEVDDYYQLGYILQAFGLKTHCDYTEAVLFCQSQYTRIEAPSKKRKPGRRRIR